MKKETEEIFQKHFSKAINALMKYEGKTATVYISDKLVVHATWHWKPRQGDLQRMINLTFGAPNYLDRKFIKACKEAGEPFPVKKVIIRPWPKKKAKK